MYLVIISGAAARASEKEAVLARKKVMHHNSFAKGQRHGQVHHSDWFHRRVWNGSLNSKGTIAWPQKMFSSKREVVTSLSDDSST